MSKVYWNCGKTWSITISASSEYKNCIGSHKGYWCPLYCLSDSFENVYFFKLKFEESKKVSLLQLYKQLKLYHKWAYTIPILDFELIFHLWSMPCPWWNERFCSLQILFSSTCIRISFISSILNHFVMLLTAFFQENVIFACCSWYSNKTIFIIFQ